MSRFASAPWPLKAAYIGVLSVSAFTVLAGLSMFIALVGLKRLSSHMDVTAVPAWLWYFRHDPRVFRWFAVGLLISIGLGVITAAGIARNLRPPLHGAARWASEAELGREGLRSKQGIVLGRKGGRLLIFGGPEHVMLYAPTRTGKGVGVVIPNLLTWPDSVVVLDVKRENWVATAGFRAAHGQTVLLFDPLDPEGRSARYNPLGHINRSNSIEVLDELQKLSVMLFPTSAGADPFWAEAARTGFIGVGAYVAARTELPFSLGVIYRELTDGDPRSRLPAEIASRRSSGIPLSVGCVSALTDFCSASENTFSSVKQTITSRMGLWLNPRLCAATDASDFDLRDLRTKRISLYLAVSPDNLERIAPLYSLLLQQLLDLNTRSLPAPGAKGIEVLLLLDEFARLGHAAMIAHAFAYVAGYGLRLLAVLQSPAQLRREYGPDLAEEIMANCGVEVAFAPKELKVAQDLSERLGFWTYAGRSSSRPTALSTGRRSLTESDQRRALRMPQELIQMPRERLIVLRAGMPPILGRKIVYWRERSYQRRVIPAPTVSPFKLGGPFVLTSQAPPEGSQQSAAREATSDPLSLELVIPLLADSGLERMPEIGADSAEVEAWVGRYIDSFAQMPAQELPHGR